MTSQPAVLPANHWARSERAALSDLFLELGPEAPTLCEGWNTRDLAGHLIVREGRIDAALGIMIPALASYADKVRLKAQAGEWSSVVEKVRNGPPKTSMMRAEKVDGAANTIEFFVHLEDVRRAQSGWEPRTLDPALQAELWTRLAKFAPRLMKASPVGLVLVTPEGATLTVKEGPTPVTITGEPAELTMFAYGRKEARVEMSGSDEAKAAVAATSFGL